MWTLAYLIFDSWYFHPKSIKKWAKLEVAPKKEWKYSKGILNEPWILKPTTIKGAFDITGDKQPESILIKGLWRIRPGRHLKFEKKHGYKFYIHHLLITDGKSNEILVFYDAKLFPIPFFKECFRKDQITHEPRQIWRPYHGPPDSWRYSLPKNLQKVLDGYVPPMWTCFSKFFKFMCEILSYFPNAPKSAKLKLKKLASQNIPNTWPEASKFLKEYEKILDSLLKHYPYKELDSIQLDISNNGAFYLFDPGKKFSDPKQSKDWLWKWTWDSEYVSKQLTKAHEFRDYLKWLPCCNAFVAYSEVREW